MASKHVTTCLLKGMSLLLNTSLNLTNCSVRFYNAVINSEQKCSTLLADEETQ